MKLGVKNLTRGLEYHGTVSGKRQTYYVLSAPRMFFVLSLSPTKRSSGNFNLIPKAGVDKLHRRLRGHHAVTAKVVHSRSRDKRHIPTTLTALNMLYILVATGRATIDTRRKARELYFNIHR